MPFYENLLKSMEWLRKQIVFVAKCCTKTQPPFDAQVQMPGTAQPELFFASLQAPQGQVTKNISLGTADGSSV